MAGGDPAWGRRGVRWFPPELGADCAERVPAPSARCHLQTFDAVNDPAGWNELKGTRRGVVEVGYSCSGQHLVAQGAWSAGLQP